MKVKTFSKEKKEIKEMELFSQTKKADRVHQI